MPSTVCSSWNHVYSKPLKVFWWLPLFYLHLALHHETFFHLDRDCPYPHQLQQGMAHWTCIHRALQIFWEEIEKKNKSESATMWKVQPEVAQFCISVCSTKPCCDWVELVCTLHIHSMYYVHTSTYVVLNMLLVLRFTTMSPIILLCCSMHTLLALVQQCQMLMV